MLYSSNLLPETLHLVVLNLITRMLKCPSINQPFFHVIIALVSAATLSLFFFSSRLQFHFSLIHIGDEDFSRVSDTTAPFHNVALHVCREPGWWLSGDSSWVALCNEAERDICRYGLGEPRMLEVDTGETNGLVARSC